METGIGEVPEIPADSFDYRKRLQPGHMLMEQMDSRSGCLENSEMDEVRARVPRNTFVGACYGHRRDGCLSDLLIVPAR